MCIQERKILDLTVEVRYSTFQIVVKKKKKNSFHAVGTLLIFLTYNWARYQLLVTSFIKDNDHNLLRSTEKAGLQLSYPKTDQSGSPDGLNTNNINITWYFKKCRNSRPTSALLIFEVEFSCKFK